VGHNCRMGHQYGSRVIGGDQHCHLRGAV